MGNERIGAAWVGTTESLRDYSNIPAGTLDRLCRYVTDGIDPGDFLRAVLENDLNGAFAHGDLSNIRALWAIVTFVYNRCPAGCRGSKRDVEVWKRQGGLKGYVVGDAVLANQLTDEWSKDAMRGIR